MSTPETASKSVPGVHTNAIPASFARRWLRRARPSLLALTGVALLVQGGASARPTSSFLSDLLADRGWAADDCVAIDLVEHGRGALAGQLVPAALGFSTSAALRDDGLLIADAAFTRVAKAPVTGGPVVDGLTGFENPVRIAQRPGGGLLVLDRRPDIRDRRTDPKTPRTHVLVATDSHGDSEFTIDAGRRWLQSDEGPAYLSAVYQIAELGDGGPIVAIGDVERGGEVLSSLLVLQPGDDRYRPLGPLFDHATMEYVVRDIGPFLASVGDSVLVFVPGEKPWLGRVDKADPGTLHTLDAFPVDLSSPALPLAELPAAGTSRLASRIYNHNRLTTLYRLVERAALPLGIVNLRGVPGLITKGEPDARGDVPWAVTTFSATTGAAGRSVQLPTSAPHATVASHRDGALGIVEKGRVESIGEPANRVLYRNTFSAVLVPETWRRAASEPLSSNTCRYLDPAS